MDPDMTDEQDRGHRRGRQSGWVGKWRRCVAVAACVLAVAGAAAYVFRPLSPDEASKAGRPGRPPAPPERGAEGYAVGETLASAPASGTGRGTGSGSPTGNGPGPAPREIEWSALIPQGWDPMGPLRDLKLDQLADGDPRAQQALATAMEHWKNAPVEPALDGASVRIPGFVVSLGGEGEALREFLLVPYFGACIHVPPPPANQVIHVRLSEPARQFRTMDPVWVSGVMKIERAETMMGDSGYAMGSATVEAYAPPTSQSRGQ